MIPLPKEIAAGIKKIEKRENWNRPAAVPFGLPNETWREHIARRTRCLELRDKLQRGEVHEINEQITLNLNVWQFARDVIVNSDSPELLRAFWHPIQSVTVLDPTCGSGAFLFAALRILETLYSDCLERMERFIQSADLALPDFATAEEVAETPASAVGKRKGGKGPQIYSDFRKVLDQISEHRGQKYFILKSIIINNLFGVDIMEEAVEICKLRLFLKLVAQVEKADQIEPLPDIDFNIRTGNTLVGYVTLDEVRKARAAETSGRAKQRLLMDDDADEEIRRIEEDARAVQAAVEHFREQQTTHGGLVTAKDKAELRRRLAELDGKLNLYLAGEYGIVIKSKTSGDLEKWKSSHQPFHWFVDFNGIMSRGGFDVVIGNPPYVEYSKVRGSYTVRGFKTIECGNLFALAMERSYGIASSVGRLGLIVPLSLACTDRMHTARSELLRGTVWLPCFDIRPSSLFEGVAQRLAIVLQHNKRSTDSGCRLFTGGYRRWSVEEREHLMALTNFVEASFNETSLPIAKISGFEEADILAKIRRHKSITVRQSDSAEPIYLHRICRYFIKALNFVPYFKNAEGIKGKSEDYKPFGFKDDAKESVVCFLNSTLFYWLWRSHGDGFHCGYGDVYQSPFPDSIPSDKAQQLSALCDRLMHALQENSVRKTIRTRKGEITYQEFSPTPTKPILDEIDIVLGSVFGLSAVEREFIINYDIKYRLGQLASADDEQE